MMHTKTIRAAKFAVHTALVIHGVACLWHLVGGCSGMVLHATWVDVAALGEYMAAWYWCVDRAQSNMCSCPGCVCV